MASIEMKIPLNLEISDETVALCLKVIELWLNEDTNRDLVIHTVKRADGFHRVVEAVNRANMRGEEDE